MNLCIIGTGYVGLVSGVCFAELGNKVICVDSDKKKIKMLNNNIMPIYEKDLKEMCVQNREVGRIEFTTDLDYGVKNSDIIFIAVGTPSLPDGEVDMSAVEAVAKNIAKSMNGYKIIVNKSTVPVGTQKRIVEIIKRNKIEKHNFDVVSNPEFLREGSAINDAMNPDRIIIGSDSDRATKAMVELQKPLNAPIEVMEPESAEMVKYAANAFLATKISFINEIANICERVGADVEKIAKGIGLDHRISDKFLKAGIGFGGSCFPKDTKAIVGIGQKVGYNFKIVKSVIEVNEKQRLKVIEKLMHALGEVRGKTIGILGLAFKPGTDDMREAPSIDIVNKIQELGGYVKAYDPAAMKTARKIFEDVDFCSNVYDAVRETDAIILVTEWDEFREIDLQKIKAMVKNPVFIDGRNVFDFEIMSKLGFEYYCIGKKDSGFKSISIEEVAASLNSEL